MHIYEIGDIVRSNKMNTTKEYMILGVISKKGGIQYKLYNPNLYFNRLFCKESNIIFTKEYDSNFLNAFVPFPIYDIGQKIKYIDTLSKDVKIGTILTKEILEYDLKCIRYSIKTQELTIKEEDIISMCRCNKPIKIKKIVPIVKK